MVISGFAASRAECLWLSVKPPTLSAATPPEAKPYVFSKVRPESQRHSAREAAKPQINLSTNYNP
jgi:hypothetical protein